MFDNFAGMFQVPFLICQQMFNIREKATNELHIMRLLQLLFVTESAFISGSDQFQQIRVKNGNGNSDTTASMLAGAKKYGSATLFLFNC